MERINDYFDLLLQTLRGHSWVSHEDLTFRQIDNREMCKYVRGLLPRKQVIVFTNDNIFADSLPQGKHIDLPHTG